MPAFAGQRISLLPTLPSFTQVVTYVLAQSSHMTCAHAENLMALVPGTSSKQTGHWTTVRGRLSAGAAPATPSVASSGAATATTSGAPRPSAAVRSTHASTHLRSTHLPPPLSRSRFGRRAPSATLPARVRSTTDGGAAAMPN